MTVTFSDWLGQLYALIIITKEVSSFAIIKQHSTYKHHVISLLNIMYKDFQTEK